YFRCVRTLLDRYCAMPTLAHSTFPESSFRRNARMMVKDRGLPASPGGHCTHHHVELIQRVTEDWTLHVPIFP
ncbi:unnamed protein product, partial [Hapterophycus canaliculatus]